MEALTSRLPRRGRPSRPSFADAAEAHLDDVHAYLVYLVGDRDLAEDLTAETFEKALARWRRFDPARGTARTWLCQVARSVALDHFRADERRRRRERAYASREPTEERPPLVDGLSPALERALRSLSAADREVLGLRIVLELDAGAVARLLGISTTACTTRLNRALHRLEERMRDANAA